ncbi:MAG: Carboxyl-terminal processing protease [Parcubacteria group bacterium]|nr:Carboxyl-terminal processing protease [Parcubacteria group bacterium]
MEGRQFTEEEDEFESAPAARPPFKPTKKALLGILLVVLVVGGFVGGVFVGAKTGTRVFSNVPVLGDGLDATPNNSLDFTDFWKVYNVLNTRFVQTHSTTTPPTGQQLVWGAIQGMTAVYGDPYTVFFPPDQSKQFQSQIQGNFEGIGAEIGLNNDNVLTIIAPLKGSPAEKDGLLAGDLITAINGKSTEGISVDEAVTEIRGPKGSVVDFSVYRSQKMIDVKVTRDTVEIPEIKSSYDASTGIYTIALYTFTANSGDLFNTALQDMQKSGAKKLIIDLRGNPGGYLDAAVSIASHFLPSGDVVVTEDYKGKQENLVHKSAGSGGIPDGLKTVILIDQGSASASEILSGALQDDHVATLIGTRSFGKGSVQELVKVGDASLKVTVARWLTPSGRSISLSGLTADIKVDRTQADVDAGKDPQMARAIQFLTMGK